MALNGAKVIKAALGNTGTIQSVRYTENGTAHEIYCQHLVLPAGVWTSPLLEELFPASSLDLKHKTDGLSWMIIKNLDEASQRDQITLLMYPRLEEGTLELASREDGTIWVGNGPDSEDRLPVFESSGVFDPVERSVDRFRALIHRFIKPLAKGNAKLEVLKEGLSYRPTNHLGRPIIAAIPKGKRMAVPHGEEQAQQSGLYVCTGQGYYGVTLSFGSGKVMSAVVLNMEPDIDIGAFGLPE